MNGKTSSVRILACLLVAGCAAEPSQVLCSESVDFTGKDPTWLRLYDQIHAARANHTVLAVHGHVPGEVLQISTIRGLFDLAAKEDLPVIRYDQIATATEGGLAFAIDDNAIDDWFALRPLFAEYGAHITFFVSRWELQPQAQIDELLQLAADGHELEPHTVNHLHTLSYIHDHGLDAWLTDEVDPSIEIMRQHGLEPAFFAYPFGERDDATDAALLERVGTIRASGHYCR
jgi:hypothetical protein